MKKMIQRHGIETLESRIAPAYGAFLASANGLVATYDDVDGDHVTVKLTAGFIDNQAPPGAVLGIEAGPLGDGSGYLRFLDLTHPRFNGTSITFTVVKVPGGDGLANVGAIFAGANDLGSVVIKGDLGKIDAGSDALGQVAIKSLSARSMGRFGIDTQQTDLTNPIDLPPQADYFVSTIKGELGSLTITGDVKDVWINVLGSAGIGSVTIGGSLIGLKALDSASAGVDQKSGVITAGGDIRSVKIAGDIRGGDARNIFGGAGAASGAILSTNGSLKSVTVGGSLIGGSAPASGVLISFGDMGPVKIGRNIVGDTGAGSGVIQSLAKLASVTVGGSVLGGAGTESGLISSAGDVGFIKIGQDFIGGSITGSASLDRSGVIESTGGRIGSITLGGSILSGTDTSSGVLTSNATIRVADDLGSLTVKGNIAGNTADGAAGNFSPVLISARGMLTQKVGLDLAIGRITVGGSVDHTSILAGYQTDLTPINGDAQIGAVKITGDWAASNLIAGVRNTASGNKTFGDGNDATIGSGASGIIAKIASVTIGGEVIARPGSTATFGFAAEQIGSFKYNGASVALAAGASTDKFSGVGLAGTARPVGPSLSPTMNDRFAVHVFEV